MLSLTLALSHPGQWRFSEESDVIAFYEEIALKSAEHVPMGDSQILSTISGSLAEDIIAERDDR